MLVGLWCSTLSVKREIIVFNAVEPKRWKPVKNWNDHTLTGVSNGCVLPLEYPVDFAKHSTPHSARVCCQTSV